MHDLNFFSHLFTAGANGQLRFLEDGKEYIYQTEAAASAGTMDYASASSGFSYKMKTRVQVSGRTLNIKVRIRFMKA